MSSTGDDVGDRKVEGRGAFSFFSFFFSSRRRHTRYIGDWSSDVCSSDLSRGVNPKAARLLATLLDHRIAERADLRHRDPDDVAGLQREVVRRDETRARQQEQIGRASCRERVEMAVVAVGVREKSGGEMEL